MPAKYLTKSTRYGLPPGRAPYMPPAEASESRKIRYSSEWLMHSIPVDSQGDTNACVGYTTANWIEAMLRKTHGRDVLKPGQQIDGEAIWRRGREMFWPKESVESGGLWLWQGFEAAIDMGVLPPATATKEIKSLKFEVLSEEMAKYPLAMAQATHNGWNFPQRESGFIKRMKGDPAAGHAVLMVAMLKQGGKPYAMLQNSWGLDWGWHGCGILSESHWQLNALTVCCTAELPPMWRAWGGWRRFIKDRPETAT
jgi:hypothetical protein